MKKGSKILIKSVTNIWTEGQKIAHTMLAYNATW